MGSEGDSTMGDGSKTESDYDVLYRIMTTRMSVRRLRPDPIPDEYVDKILEAGRWAMSGANGQPWEYLVIKDPKKKKALYDAFQDTNQEFCFWMEQMRPFELRHPAFQVKGDDLQDEWQKIRNSTGGQQRRPWHEAPVVIVVLGDGRRQWATVNAAFTFGRHASHFTDGLANTCTHMQLAIASLGLADIERKPGVRRELNELVHRETYDMSKYMSNEDIIDYLYKLRGKTMFRYHLKDSLLPGAGEKKS